jgi:hypothetical protein
MTGDEALAIHGDAEAVLDAGQQLGDVEGGTGLLEYVECHVNLGQTVSLAWGGGFGLAVAKSADGAKLSVQRGFECG